MNAEMTEGERLRALEERWGLPPWEIALDAIYGPEVMARVEAVTIDGVRFARQHEPDSDGPEVTD